MVAALGDGRRHRDPAGPAASQHGQVEGRAGTALLDQPAQGVGIGHDLPIDFRDDVLGQEAAGRRCPGQDRHDERAGCVRLRIPRVSAHHQERGAELALVHLGLRHLYGLLRGLARIQDLPLRNHHLARVDPGPQRLVDGDAPPGLVHRGQQEVPLRLVHRPPADVDQGKDVLRRAGAQDEVGDPHQVEHDHHQQKGNEDQEPSVPSTRLRLAMDEGARRRLVVRGWSRGLRGWALRHVHQLRAIAGATGLEPARSREGSRADAPPRPPPC